MKTLQRRLRAVEALIEGATTEGERQAAEKARARLVARLDADEDARKVVGPWGWQPPDEALVDVPCGERIRGWLLSWAAGDITTVELQKLAAFYVDKVVLPLYDPSDARSTPIELLLQLSMKRQPLTPDDVPDLLHFLDAPEGAEAAWAAWFVFLEDRFGAPRRRVCG